MTLQDHIKLNRAKCLSVSLSVCEIQVYWAAYAAKNDNTGSVIGHQNAQGGTQKSKGGDTETHRVNTETHKCNWLTDWQKNGSYRSGANITKNKRIDFFTKLEKGGGKNYSGEWIMHAVKLKRFFFDEVLWADSLPVFEYRRGDYCLFSDPFKNM